jgi:acetylornithine deacetylase
MNLFTELLVDSHSRDYNALVNVIATYLEETTDAQVIIQKIDEKRSNVIAKFGNPKLLINCHLDTVPPQGEWQNDPLTLTDDGDKYYGLGTTDTKGNIYCALKAAAETKPQNLMLLFSVDEESGKGNAGVKAFLASELKEGLEHAIICEPTGLKFVNNHKSYYSYIFSMKTESAHSALAGPEIKNAITEAAMMIVELDTLGFNVGSVSGGSLGNIVADKCEFKASVRTFESPETVSNQLNNLIAKYPGADVKTHFIGLPLTTSGDFHYFTGEFHEVPFWTEAPLFAAAGINSVVFGAGHLEQAHTTDEFVEKAQLDGALKVFEQIMGGL